MESINQVTTGGAGRPAPPLRRGWERFELGPLLNLATLLMVAGTAIMMIEGFSRSFFSVSHFWAEESVRYLTLWAFFLTLGATGSSGNHIRTDLMLRYLPARFHAVMHFLASLIGAGFALTLVWASWPQLKRYYTMGMMTESNLDLPMWVLFLAMPLGGILLAIYYLRCLVQVIRGHNPFASASHLPNEEL